MNDVSRVSRVHSQVLIFFRNSPSSKVLWRRRRRSRPAKFHMATADDDGDSSRKLTKSSNHPLGHDVWRWPSRSLRCCCCCWNRELIPDLLLIYRGALSAPHSIMMMVIFGNTVAKFKLEAIFPSTGPNQRPFQFECRYHGDRWMVQRRRLSLKIKLSITDIYGGFSSACMITFQSLVVILNQEFHA